MCIFKCHCPSMAALELCPLKQNSHASLISTIDFEMIFFWTLSLKHTHARTHARTHTHTHTHTHTFPAHSMNTVHFDVPWIYFKALKELIFFCWDLLDKTCNILTLNFIFFFFAKLNLIVRYHVRQLETLWDVKSHCDTSTDIVKY